LYAVSLGDGFSIISAILQLAKLGGWSALALVAVGDPGVSYRSGSEGRG
jgi:hypothetical protein